MSFLKSLFGGSAARDAGPKRALAEEQYKGCTIRAVEMRAGAQYQLAGSIEKLVGGQLKMHKFIRADTLPDRDEMIAAALAKGRQLVDEQGEALFH
ncbi:MAG: HlyU family transcriptional regulator [Cucumibacter sp.]